MKIAILFICTGKYSMFFDGFYQSAERYFLRNEATKDYYVFTDNKELSTAPNVHLIYHEYNGFPADSLFRYDMFLAIEDELRSYDYLFHFNANMVFVTPVGKEFLPTKHDLVVALHPGYYNKPSFLYPYERRRSSKAYIKPYQGNYHYYMGGLNGGRASAYLEFVRTLSERIHDDYDRGIIAMYHDESHLNCYIRELEFDCLSPAYGYPEGWNLPFEPVIILRDKALVDPQCKDFTKNRRNSLGSYLAKAYGYAMRAVRWYLCI